MILFYFILFFQVLASFFCMFSKLGGFVVVMGILWALSSINIFLKCVLHSNLVWVVVCVVCVFCFLFLSRSHHLLFILAFSPYTLDLSLFLAIDKWVFLASSIDYHLVGQVCFHSLMEGTCQHLPM